MWLPAFARRIASVTLVASVPDGVVDSDNPYGYRVAATTLELRYLVA